MVKGGFMSKGLEALTRLRNDECIVLEQYNECYDIIEKELKALEIIKKYPKNRNSLANFRYMVDYWEKNNIEVTKKLLETYDFPFEVEEYDLLKEVLL